MTTTKKEKRWNFRSDPDPLFPDPDRYQNDTDPQHWKIHHDYTLYGSLRFSSDIIT